MATPVRRVVGKVGLVLTRKVATQRSAAANKRKAKVGKLLARIDAKGRVIGCVLCAMGMWGCEQATAPHIDQPVSQIIVQAVPQDPPAFEMTYTEWITPQVQVVLHMKTYAFGRSDRFGELRQADGKYVLFVVGRVAEKIVQPELVPLVERSIKQMLAMDADYINSKPTQFVDKHGVTWEARDGR